MTSCASCGMPLRTAEDHAASDTNKDYCKHCADASGALKSYEQVHSGMVAFLIRTQGMTPSVADAMAREMLSKTRIWSAVSQK